MPATYAHRRLGDAVLARLPDQLQQQLSPHHDAWAFGLHGPDPLFFYRPLKKTPISERGHAMHRAPAAEFFAPAAELYRSRGERPEDLAYLLGFLCHFALDSVCHPLVSARMQEASLSHAEVESQYDYYLLRRDGLSPLKTDICAHLHPSQALAEGAAPYLGTDATVTLRAMRSFCRYSRLLRVHRQPARFLLESAMKLCGCYDGLHGMLIPLHDTKTLVESGRAVQAGFGTATEKAVDLIGNYCRFLRGEEDLHADFLRNFE